MADDPFITSEDVAEYLGRDIADDPGTVMAVDAACDMCRTIADQTFNAGTTTVSMDGTGTDSLVLPEWPVGTVSAVLVNGEAVDFAVGAGWVLRGSAGDNPRPVWPQGRQNVTVTYSHGYEEVPRDVRRIALDLAARMVLQGVTVGENIGDASVRYAGQAGELSANELRILSRYRHTKSF